MPEEPNTRPVAPDAVSQSPTGTADGSAPESIASESPETIAELEAALAERDRAEAEKADILHQYQRAQAEFENIRKRLQREQREVREYAAMETIEQLLPIVDDFERALDAPGLDPDLQKGLELIRTRMLDVFRRAGLAEVETAGVFDPNVHEAVDRAAAESDRDDQKVLDVYRRGYRFKDRLLRPAMVKVAVKE